MEFALLLRRVCASIHTCGKCYYSLKRREKSLEHLKPSASIMGSIRLDPQASGIRRTVIPLQLPSHSAHLLDTLRLPVSRGLDWRDTLYML